MSGKRVSGRGRGGESDGRISLDPWPGTVDTAERAVQRAHGRAQLLQQLLSMLSAFFLPHFSELIGRT